MTSDIWIIDWNNYLNLHQKAKHGGQIAEKTLKKAGSLAFSFICVLNL